MKTILFAILIASTSLLSFTPAATETTKDTATANQYEGIYIFTDSKPAAAYDYLGTVKMGMTLGSGQYTDVRDGLIKKAKKQFPGCDGLVITFAEGGTDKADAIKFK